MKAQHNSKDSGNQAAARLLAWYDAHHRDLPWRVPPARLARGERPDPYLVWLSEIMLQQTTVEAVKPYFARFSTRWPSVEALAGAADDDVMKEWAGLGYYSRARNLKACAGAIVAEHGGRFPDTEAGLRALPGIGPYTAAAVAAIAFGRPAAVVDGNVERVMARLHAIATPLSAAKAGIRAHVEAMLPDDRPGDFAQAMMDLGATLCSPKRPKCLLCPLNDDCAALAEGEPEHYPVRPAKKEKPRRRGAAFIALRGDGAVLLRKRPQSGLLAGMAEPPTSGFTARTDGETGIAAAPFAASWKPAGAIGQVWQAQVADAALPEGWWWSAPEALAGEALPTVMKKAIAAAVPDAFAQGRKAG
jgi:A/G-specific adenine glycosylase